MKLNKKVLALCIILFLLFLTNIFYEKMPKKIVESKKISIENINTIAEKVMFVAHPDDETLWAGNELLNEKYLVVCVTCGSNETRAKEFKDVMQKTKDDYILLGYPDINEDGVDNWDNYYDEIEEKIKQILSSKEWNKIVVHNPEGEYGHEHHIMVSNMVTANVTDRTKLYYFKKYNSCKKIDTMSEEGYKLWKDKISVLTSYKTQLGAIINLAHVTTHEKLTSFETRNR